jgi:acyl-CoA synthetase (AMP-forming)/AMP-acid ligase II
MQLSPKTRVEAYRRKGWWLGKSVDQIFRESLSTNPTGPALIDAPNRQALTGTRQQVIDWAEMDGRVNGLVAAMQRLGVGRDDIVVTQLPNVVEGVLFFLACARLGAILSPVALAYRGHELRQILPKLNPKIFVTIPTFHGHDHARAIVELQASGLPTGTIICLGDEAPNGAQALGPLLAEIGSDAPGIDLDPPADGADILTICWTSGTEAQPKGVPRHHDHWTVNGEAMVEAAGLRPGDRILNPFPLINIASFGGMVMPWLMMAGCLVQHHPFDLPTFLDQLQREKIAYTVAPPAVLTMLLKNTDFMNNANLTALRCLGSGSAPLAPWMVKEWQDRFGVTVMNVFGSNEGCSLFSTGAMIPDPEHRARFFPRFGAEGINWGAGFATKIRTRLVDLDTDTDITEPGQIGELRIDGAMTFDGYWQADQLNKLAFDDHGYFKTGDLFEIAAEGDGRFYQFVGRSKEIVIRGGQNISPAEVDTLIEGHPAIREASCVGYPDERLGERICAVVVLKPGCKLSLEELCSFLKQADVAVYKLPERLKIVEALPRNALGKVLRRELAPIALAL